MNSPDISIENLLKMPVLKSYQAALIMQISTTHFLWLVKKELLPLKPLPHSKKVKYWSTSDLKRYVDNNYQSVIIDSDDETATLLRAFNKNGDIQSALPR